MENEDGQNPETHMHQGKTLSLKIISYKDTFAVVTCILK